MKKLCVLSALTLTACGGGGDSPAPANNPIASNSAPEPVYFTEVKNAIPSLLTYYNALPCGKKANVNFMPSIDMNGDSRKDLLFMLWCENSYSVKDNNPGINTVVSLIQNSDGTFRFGNQEIFGKDNISLHGVLGEITDYGLGDFNNDGKQDIALSLTLEDGRAFVRYEDGTANWNSYPVVMLSQPDGTYKFEQLPHRGYVQQIIIIREDNADKFLAGEYIYSYSNQIWNAVKRSSKNYKIDTSSVFFDNNMVSQVFDDEKLGIKLGVVTNVDFTQNDYYHISNLQKVKIYDSRILGEETFSLASIDGVDYVLPSLPTSCMIPAGNGEILYFVEFQGIQLTEKYTGQKLSWNEPNTTGNVTWANGRSKVLAYKVSRTKITKLDTTIFDGLYEYGYGLSCMDVNADNQKDVVLYRWGKQKAVIWLNKNSTFSLVPGSKIPNSDRTWSRGHHSLITDLNGDNKAEFIYGPILGYNEDYVGQYDDYQFFKAVDPL